MNNNFWLYSEASNKTASIDTKNIKENTEKYTLVKWAQKNFSCKAKDKKGEAFAIVLSDDTFKTDETKDFFKKEEIAYNIEPIKNISYFIEKLSSNYMFFDSGASALVCKTPSWYIYDFSNYISSWPTVLVNFFQESLREWSYDEAIRVLFLASDYNVSFVGLKTFTAVPYYDWVLILSKDINLHEPVFGYKIGYLSFINESFVELTSRLYINLVWDYNDWLHEWIALIAQEAELNKECDEAVRNAFENAKFGEPDFLPEDSICHQKVLETFTAMLEKDTTATSIFEKKIKRFLQEIEKIENQ